MATVEQVLDAIAHVRACTGDTTGGLTPAELTDVVMSIPGGGIAGNLEGILAHIRRRYPTLFDSATGAPTAPAGAAPDHQQGDTADAARHHEDALARQTTASAQLDLLVLNAIRNAHRKARSAAGALDLLQQEIEDAVRTRTDLDTVAGARDFQRFLIGKLGEIEAVLQNANLDDASYRALLTACTALYNTGIRQPDAEPPAAAPAAAAGVDPQPDPDPLAWEEEDPALLPAEAPPAAPPPPVPPPAALPFTPPPLPAFGAGGIPGPGALPGGAGLPLADLMSSLATDPGTSLADRLDDEAWPLPEGDDVDDPKAQPDAGTDPATPDPAAGPTTVTLPDGETVTAASPQLAAAIQAAAEGTPIPDAFAQQGITIPAPGTAVAEPIEPDRVAPGDIGMFTDRHALALGNSKALFNGQMQHISTVAGPSFLGWEHPPEPGTTPVRVDAPTPTRPAGRAGG